MAKRYGINQKTVAKSKERTVVQNLPTGPRDAHSAALNIKEEVTFTEPYNWSNQATVHRIGNRPSQA